MDIVRFKGGLGNQMFQYAFMRSLADKGRNVKADLGYYKDNRDRMPFCLTEVFQNVTLEVIDEGLFDKINQEWRIIKQDRSLLQEFLANPITRFFWVEKENGVYDAQVFETTACTFVGYWQSEKYFTDIRKQLSKEFVFGCGDEQFEELRSYIKKKENCVSVHIRRGDYLKKREVYGDLYADGYYEKAIAYIKEHMENPVFIFFSDDIQWVKERYQDEKGIFIEQEMFQQYRDWYDMCLMSCCTGNIISNSSFSWWGAWLNKNENKVVVAPRAWLKQEDTKDIWGEGWIKM